MGEVLGIGAVPGEAAPAVQPGPPPMHNTGARDTSRDGLRNRIEVALLTGLRPVWQFVNRRPALARLCNRVIVNNAVLKVPTRPLALSTAAPYTSWPSLTDHSFFSRYLPPRAGADPAVGPGHTLVYTMPALSVSTLVLAP